MSEANVFYDSGAQISIIRRSYAESLALEGKPINIVITKVGGVEEELTTKLYKVPVYNSDGKRVQIVQAVGIAQISEDSPNGNISEVSKIFDIPTSMLKHKVGPIDLLIGINYPHGNAARTPIRDETSETDHTQKRRFRQSAIYQTIKALSILRCLYGSEMVLLGVVLDSLVSVKCLALIFHKKMTMQYSWSNVNLWLNTTSNKQLWIYITFFPKSF
jgi:hypothetical protein